MKNSRPNQWLECVPNFSEGRDRAKIQALGQAIQSVKGVYLLGSEEDFDHHRSVFTFVGPVESVIEGAYLAVKKAVEILDLNHHSGVHPRLGVADVVPLIPLWDTSMKTAIQSALTLAKSLGNDLKLPIYLYGQSAQVADRHHLADVRRGGLEALQRTIHDKKKPDFGPTNLHPTAGACCVGARDFLVAYNMVLNSQDLKTGKKIARRIRKMEGVKSLAFPLKSRKKIQVSMNITDFRLNSIPQVFEQVENMAREKGLSVKESELIGLVPGETLQKNFGEKYKIQNLTSQKILEMALLDQILREQPAKTMDDYLGDLSAPRSSPGGGSAAGVCASVGASLLKMAFSLGKKYPTDQEQSWTSAENMIGRAVKECARLAKEDELAYQNFVRINQLKDPSKKTEKKEALLRAAQVPLNLMKTILSLFQRIPLFLKYGKKSLAPDGRSGFYILRGAFQSAEEMVLANLAYLKGEDGLARNFKEIQEREREIRKTIEELLQS